MRRGLPVRLILRQISRILVLFTLGATIEGRELVLLICDTHPRFPALQRHPEGIRSGDSGSDD